MRFTKIPFCGFYHSSLDMAIDSAIEMEAYNRVEDGSNDGDESSYPEALRLSESDVCEAFCGMGVCDFQALHLEMVKEYLDQFNSLCEDHLGFDPELTFESMTSPREYNFETDRLFAYVPDSTIQKLWEMNAADKFESFADIIAERFTSYGGFISHYPHDLESWLKKPLADYDHNELETLLMAALESRGESVASVCQESESHVYDGFNGNGDFDSHVKWDKFESELAKMRIQLLENLDDFEAADVLLQLSNSYPDGYKILTAEMDADYLSRLEAMASDSTITPRCPLTPDMFVNQESTHV